jgi:quercetin dioxygenase-like cupin family protein
MPFVDTSSLDVIERLPGWRGRYFHSASMTFAHYDFDRGSSIHEHFHPQEEVWEVIEGEIELTVDGVAQITRPGLVAIVPPNVRHSVKALTDGRAIIVYPLRRIVEFGHTKPRQSGVKTLFPTTIVINVNRESDLKEEQHRRFDVRPSEPV